MKHANEFEDEVDDVPVSPLFAEGRKNPYGSVPGLDDEELADPCELERQVALQDWGPILALPTKTRRGWIRPTIEDGHVDWGAFGSVDFDRVRPEFDKARYKAEKLQEQLKDVFLMFETISARLPPARHQVLRLAEQGIIELEDIQNEDMRHLALYYLRARRLQKQIAELRELSWKRRQAKAARWLEE